MASRAHRRRRCVGRARTCGPRSDRCDAAYSSTSCGRVWNLPATSPIRPSGPTLRGGVSLPPVGSSADRLDQRCDLGVRQSWHSFREGMINERIGRRWPMPWRMACAELLVRRLGGDQGQVGRVDRRDVRLVEELGRRAGRRRGTRRSASDAKRRGPSASLRRRRHWPSCSGFGSGAWHSASGPTRSRLRPQPAMISRTTTAST